MGKRFEIVREGTLPVGQVDVFDGFTTGTAGWLWPVEYEPREGGAAGFGGTVTVWDPPHKVVSRMEGPDGWFNELSHEVVPAPGGAHFRYVHSGIFVDDWEQQYDGASQHTDFYLHTFAQYLLHFRGRPATYSTVDYSEPLDFRRIAGDAAQGATAWVDLPVVGAAEAVVDYRHPHFLGLRTGDAMIRFFGRSAFGGTDAVAVHDFAGTDPQELENAWKAFHGSGPRH
ncbi:SRPBCC family protein [Dactylosporangium sp. CA-233914]|uniref:SRPBCC family protein n=1 Tax=Dactylosporangium sp. CA-233914 TaxID=3239934 RepID=UPI003D8DCB9D